LKGNILLEDLAKTEFPYLNYYISQPKDYFFDLSNMNKRQYHINFDGEQDHAIQYLGGILEDARLVTLAIVDKLSQDEVDWQYKPGWNNIGALLEHIAAIETYFRIEFIEERKLTETESEQWLPGMEMGEFLPKLIGVKSVEDYRFMLQESRKLLINALEQTGFDDFQKRRPGYDDITGCNLAWVLYHMVEDEIYHRGQISIIRKLYKVNVTRV
jgi:uncharacterized damage-inducible protein DinB